MNSLLETLPKKCYACESCQKFTATPNQENKCLVCGHYEAQHEQFLELQLQFQGVGLENKPNYRNNFTLPENPNQERERISNNNDISSFINSYSVRDRLRALNNQRSNSHQLNVHEMATFYAPSKTQIRSNSNFNEDYSKSHSNFRLKLTVIMLPFVNNNKIITIDTEKWEILSDLDLIQDIIFMDESAVGVEQKLIEAIPIIQETGWKVLRPTNQNSLNLIPFKPNETKTGQLIKS
ncbi:hypothetical protein C1645_842737 [Glomus cerebriforme]|uniref:Uncharacterized protein n=1 Tax=Glomus cerebriforme TaxID=658196 RepID=A0A397S3X4_9GLOM|nr:hypothetical protein C1645_842737 [Glomus cerebriforme]